MTNLFSRVPIRRFIACVIVGLLVQLGAALYWTPATFILYASVGVPLVLLGVGGCTWTVLRGGSKAKGNAKERAL